jgi:hypothetical protein
VTRPKGNGKTQPLGIPSAKDKWVQGVVSKVLAAIYEKTFSKSSHGYRPTRGAHTAMKSVQTWNGITWVIEGEIKGYFDNIDHRLLIGMLSQKIKDQQFLDLIWKFLRAGVKINGRFQKTNLGLPQGGIISPVLSNIYLNDFDNYVMGIQTSRVPRPPERAGGGPSPSPPSAGRVRDTKETSVPNMEYIGVPRPSPPLAGRDRAKSLLWSKKGEERRKGLNSVELRKIKSTPRVGFKLDYVRYADNWIIGIWGNREDASQVKELTRVFLKDQLKLEFSLEKTKLTHVSKEKAYFLGYEFWSPKPKEPLMVRKKNDGPRNKQRASNVRIRIEAPYQVLLKRLIEKGFLTRKKDKSWHINAIEHWINYTHTEILYRYNWIINGYLNYYSFVDNKNIFHKLIGFIIRHSCALTLSRKYKLRSLKKTFKRYGKLLRTQEGNKEVKLDIPDHFPQRGTTRSSFKIGATSYRSSKEKKVFASSYGGCMRWMW